MDGFDSAPLVAGTAQGYRWWTLDAPRLFLDPGQAGENWHPGYLKGAKDAWLPGVNRGKCLRGFSGGHDFSEIPHEDCACGFWAYWDIRPHDLGRIGTVRVFGVVRASGQVIMGPLGFRAQKAEIVALHLPFRIEPELPPARPPRAPDYVTRALPGSSQTVTHRRFTGKVYSYGDSYVPAPFRDPPVPEPPAAPSPEDIQAARDKAEAWEAVIADRLQVMYPGAEVCATLDLMKAKYPVKSEYAPPEDEQREPATRMPCPYCRDSVPLSEIQRHLVAKHSL